MGSGLVAIHVRKTAPPASCPEARQVTQRNNCNPMQVLPSMFPVCLLEFKVVWKRFSSESFELSLERRVTVNRPWGRKSWCVLGV